MAKQKKLIEFKHSGVENVVILGMILAFFVILAPLAYTQLPLADASPKYDDITGLATSNIMEADATTAIIVVLAIAFLIPVELSLRDRKIDHKKR
ncbi:MAG: hypothetical protein HY831_01260 [Candidatus Aenigmarchaeota archaeon]|nr:hypothetical protein [Candidatus Aenigmarchaeota archaeon]